MPDVRLLIIASSVPTILVGGGVFMLYVSPLSPNYGKDGWNLIILGVFIFLIELTAYFVLNRESEYEYYYK